MSIRAALHALSRRALSSFAPIPGLVLVGALAVDADASVWFVDGSQTISGNGTAWSSAFATLDAGLAAAVDGDEIWVRELAVPYRPSTPTIPGDPRSATFDFPRGVRVIGGFQGSETQLPPLGSRLGTVLDGDIGTPGVAGDNAYHVIRCMTMSASSEITRIERFTIRNGRADGASAPHGEYGGGIVTMNHPLDIVDCELSDNYATLRGGGLYAEHSPLTILRTSFLRNTSGNTGGAIRTQVNMAAIQNCVFRDNAAVSGGAVHASQITLSGGSSRLQLQNCTFVGNFASFEGGAVRVSGTSGIVAPGSLLAVNCTFTGNVAGSSGGGVSGNTTTLNPAQCVLRNCVVWGNAAPSWPEVHGRLEVRYSDVRGGWAGAGNLDADPLFGSGYRLTTGSPCIDAGSNWAVLRDLFDLDRDTVVYEPIPYDFTGRVARFRDDAATADTGTGTSPIVDIGAYEF